MRPSIRTPSCLVLWIAVWLPAWPGLGLAANPHTDEEVQYSTDPEDAAKCRRQLNLIYGAFEEYRRRNKELPQWLSELTPEFLGDPTVLVCPFVQASGRYQEWKKEFVTVPVFGDPGRCLYAYELCQEPFRYVKGWTTRDYKQRQMELMGLGLPIVRCFAHRPVLNLGFDGSIYPSAGEWEDNFVIAPQHQAIFHSVLKLARSTPNQMVRAVLAPRPADLDERQLDLAPHYNASLLHLCRVDPTGTLLRLYPEPPLNLDGTTFDARALVHLAARRFPVQFPREVLELEVHQKCAALHFLHGTSFPVPAGTLIANYVIHYESGLPDRLVPIVYGREVEMRWFDAVQPVRGTDARPAWVSPRDRLGAGGLAIRLYTFAWTNPQPDAVIRSVDFKSAMSESAPFLMAITVEPPAAEP